MTSSTFPLPRIVVVGTGGTIAGAAPTATQTTGYQAGALPVSQLLEAVPGLDTFARIESEPVASIDSKDMSTALWLALAQRIDALLARDDVDGVVVTHGTDTLEETAYFLHLLVKSPKPVVMTAAMRPATAISADGPLNLLQAVRVAGSPAAHGRGVLVVFAGRIHSAREVAKTSTFSIDAFASPETGPLGWIHDAQIEFERRGERLHTVATPFRLGVREADAARAASSASSPGEIQVAPYAIDGALPDVDIVTSYAGVTRIAVDALVASGANGIVVAGTGGGSIHHRLLAGLSDAADQGVAVVRASRVGAGHVLHNGAASDDRLGFVSAGSLSPFKARVLLMVALASGLRGVDELQGAFDTF
ncbi:asparaginase [Pararobbsia silviterrae]|uniref:Asparaginase n=1 Tax=Pararobbsia silviterrae TaxID=1792498 RepID=A0A494XXX4_9BURK|nr:asparaginase [Pararobbsia silviterrae]RKP54775.1 asparaginase [Pararobbsia silviterrae]